MNKKYGDIKKKPNENNIKQRWLAIRFTSLPLEALGFALEGDQAILVNFKKKVFSASNHALSAGIRIGMPTCTAEMLISCNTHERDITKERKAISMLCQCLYQFTPHITKHYLETPDHRHEYGLILELSACIKLFKNIENLSHLIFDKLNKTPYHYKYGYSYTEKSAWLLSYKTQQENIVADTEDHKTFISQLNNIALNHLHKFPNTIEKLKKTGFETLGDLLLHIRKQGISPIKKRFGEEFSNYITDALGIDNNIQQISLFQRTASYYSPKEFFLESMTFDYPIANIEQLEAPIKVLLIRLTEYLRQHQQQSQTIQWNFYDIYHNTHKITVRCERIHSQWQLPFELSMIQIEQQSLPFEVDTLELNCPQTTSLCVKNDALNFGYNNKKIGQQQDFEISTAKIQARLGENAMFKINYHDHHLPEKSSSLIPIQQTANDTLAAAHKTAIRPSWIFNIPHAIGKRQNSLYWQGKLQLLQGPERIGGDWWDSSPGIKATARDYFIAKRDDNSRLWIFYDLYKCEWYVHGIFS